MMDKELYSLLEKLTITCGAVTAFWKGVDSLFAYVNKRHRGFVSEVVKEDIKEELAPLKEAIQQIRSDRDRDQRYQIQQFQKIQNTLSEIRNQ